MVSLRHHAGPLTSPSSSLTAAGLLHYQRALYIYRKAFQAYDMGYASAVAAILFIIVFLLTLLQL